MRIRSIKPEFWKSRTVASVSWDARLVLKGLESYVDDNGAGRYDMELIMTELFPRDYFKNPPEVLARVSEALTQLTEAGLVWIYEAEDTSRGGRKTPALFISNWENLQRIDKPNNGRLRRPDGTLHYRDSIIGECSESIPEALANVPEVVAPVTEEQGNRGTGEQSSLRTSTGVETAPNAKPATYSQEFENWWAGYPVKRDKARAYKAFKQALKRADLATLTQGRDAYTAWAQAHPDRELKYAEGWLNGDRWEDDLTTGTPRPVTRLDKWANLANQLDQNQGGLHVLDR